VKSRGIPARSLGPHEGDSESSGEGFDFVQAQWCGAGQLSLKSRPLEVEPTTSEELHDGEPARVERGGQLLENGAHSTCVLSAHDAGQEVCTLNTLKVCRIHYMANSKPRGRTFPASAWWLTLVQQKLEQEMVDKGGKGMPAAALRISERVGRRPAWDHAPLTRLKDGKGPITTDLAEALCLEYELPPPVLYPRSHREALLMLAVAEAFDEPGKEPTVSPEELTERAKSIRQHGIRRPKRRA
jgi:hypothetical protein